MTTKMRTLRDFRNPIGCLILLAAFAVAAGCSTAESPSGSATNMNHVLPSGSSVAGWLVLPSGGTHASTATLDYIDGGGSSGCTQCHGSDLSGGISKVSCFGNPAGCHHTPVANWATPAVHGATAKKAPGSSGFASCQICHGNNFSGGGAKVSCTNNPNATCHGPAVASPHPPKPWRASAGTTFTHTTTNPANAPVCYGCHADSPAGNLNNPHRPPTPAAAGTAPGCFNGTMCHEPAGGSASGRDSRLGDAPAGGPAPRERREGDPGLDHRVRLLPGLPRDRDDVSGELRRRLVRGVLLHLPWAERTACPRAVAHLGRKHYSHTSTDAANAPVCQQCHFVGSPNNPAGHPPTPAPAGTAPDCFNSTLCHGSVAPHKVPFNDNTHFDVVTATFEAACSACHDVSAPSTKSGPVCRTCHVAASPLTSLNCTSCHASPPSGAAYPNIAGAHSTHIALDNTGSPVSCDTCHNGLGPSLLNLNHYNRAKSRVAPGDAAFLATYFAKTGASSFDNGAALSCSNVSCHGGQATPNWQAGTLNVNSQCTNCHVFGPSLGNPQYNSPYSGEHNINTPTFPGAHQTCHELPQHHHARGEPFHHARR